MTEADRIREVYARRDETGRSARYALTEPYNLYVFQGIERKLLLLLKQHDQLPLAQRRVLDVGCGDGRWLRRLVDFGALPGNCSGIDLLPDRIERAVSLNPNMEFRLGDGGRLPYKPGSFDLVSQFVVFTSILDATTRQQVAQEMLRVLRPGGAILWYDYHMNNPNNPDVRGVKKAEIRQLFPGCVVDLRRVTLAPPLARRTVKLSWIGSLLLEKLPFLCTHYLGIIRKGENP